MADIENYRDREVRIYTERYQDALSKMQEGSYPSAVAKKEVTQKLSSYYEHILRPDLKNWVKDKGMDVYDVPMAIHEFKKSAMARFADYPALGDIKDLISKLEQVKNAEIVKRKTAAQLTQEKIAHLANTGVLGSILLQVGEGLKPLDARVKTDKLDYFLGLFDELSALKQEYRHTKPPMTNQAYKERVMAITSHSSTYALINENSRDRITEIISRDCDDSATKRNYRIAQQLEKLGVTSVTDSECRNSDNGFDGIFLIESDRGRKSVRVNTIVAGGYNIQERHIRVLVNIRDIGPNVTLSDISKESPSSPFSQGVSEMLLDVIKTTSPDHINQTLLNQVFGALSEYYPGDQSDMLSQLSANIPVDMIKEFASTVQSNGNIQQLSDITQQLQIICATIESNTQSISSTPILEQSAPGVNIPAPISEPNHLKLR